MVLPKEEFYNKIIRPGTFLTNCILKYGKVYYEKGKDVTNETIVEILGQCILKYYEIVTNQILINSGTFWNPIHLAALLNNVDILNILVKDKSVDINKIYYPNSSQLLLPSSPPTITPLACAAYTQSNDAIKYLLDNGADIEIEFESLIFWTVKGCNTAYLEQFLVLYKAVESECVIDLCSLITRGALTNNTELLNIILKHSPSSALGQTKDQETTVYLASCKGLYNVVSTLISSGVSPRKPTKYNATPIQAIFTGYYVGCLAYSKVDSIRSDEIAYKTLKVLLEHIQVPNYKIVNQFLNKSPLHLSATRGFSKCCFELIKAGSEIPVKTLSLLNEKIPNFMQVHLDNLIKLRGISSAYSKQLVSIDLRFSGTINSREKALRETSFLKFLIEDGQRQFLHHPVIETYLIVKWLFVRKYFMGSLIIYLLLLLTYSAYLLNTFVPEGNNGNFDASKTKNAAYYWLSITMVSVNLLKLLAKLLVTPNLLMRKSETWTHLMLLVLIIIVHIQFAYSSDNKIPEWQINLAAVTAFWAWLFLLNFLRRHPTLGIYVEMFYRVISNLCQFLFTYTCILIGFAMSFMVLHQGVAPFKTLPHSILRTLNMMVGELGFEDINILNSDKEEYKSRSNTQSTLIHIIYAGFIFVISIALINLLIGLAVSDIKGLRKKSKLHRTLIQINFISELEDFVFSKNLHFLPWFIAKLLVQSINLPSTHHELVKSGAAQPLNQKTPTQVRKLFTDTLVLFSRNNSRLKFGHDECLHIIHVYPNDSNDRRLPKYVKIEALQIAIRNNEHELKRDAEAETEMQVIEKQLKILQSQMQSLLKHKTGIYS